MLHVLADEPAQTLVKGSQTVRELARVTNGAEPWLLESSDQMALIRFGKAFPDAGRGWLRCRHWCGHGSGQGLVGDFEALDVEPDCKLPWL